MILLSELAKLLEAELHDADAELKIAAVASISNAAPDTLVFAEDGASFAAAAASSAAAILVSPQAAAATSAGSKPILLCGQPRLAFARAAKLLAGSQVAPGGTDRGHPSDGGGCPQRSPGGGRHHRRPGSPRGAGPRRGRQHRWERSGRRRGSRDWPRLPHLSSRGPLPRDNPWRSCRRACGRSARRRWFWLCARSGDR